MAGQPRAEDPQRERVLAAPGELGARREEGGRGSAAEQVRRGGQLGWREVLDALPCGMPVPGAVTVDALDEVIAGDQVGDDRGGVILQYLRQVVELQDLDQRQPVGDTGLYGVVQVAEGRQQPGEGLDGVRVGQPGVPVDQQPGAQRHDGFHRLEQALGRAFGEERGAEVGHAHVPGEHDLPVGDTDDQAVVRLAPGDRDEHELDSADGQLLGLAHQMVRYDLGAMAPAARQEVPEGRRPGVLVP